ncbi:MAG: hypothetical protein OXU73_00095 [Candidatus Campbellbacteria bacterium]|nr:hypothetical protein [Candidatus Campbellbacteria bacterium]
MDSTRFAQNSIWGYHISDWGNSLLVLVLTEQQEERVMEKSSNDLEAIVCQFPVNKLFQEIWCAHRVPYFDKLPYNSLVLLRQTILSLPESFFERRFLGSFLSKFSFHNEELKDLLTIPYVNEVFEPYVGREHLFPPNKDCRCVSRVLLMLHEIYFSEKDLLWWYWAGLRDEKNRLEMRIDTARKGGGKTFRHYGRIVDPNLFS